MTITDIVNRIYLLTKTNSSSFLAADMLIGINTAYNRVASQILSADGRWQWDDTTQTDFPIATTTLVNGQQDYSLAVAHLKVIGVSVKDQNGIWYDLDPIDPDDIEGDRAEYYKTSGRPAEYDKLGSSVFLYPAPDNGVSVTLSAGLKIYYQRGPAEFTSGEVSTGTKAPGFSSLFHDLIPLWVSYDYAISNGAKNANQLMLEIQRKEAELSKFYAKRDKDDRQVLTMQRVNFY